MKNRMSVGRLYLVGAVLALAAWITWPVSGISGENSGAASETPLYFEASGFGAIEPDAYEPDNTFQDAKVIILNDQKPHPELPDYKPIQSHNFHVAVDEDWVKFLIRKGEIYKITVDSPGDKCDAVIGIYDMDGQTLIKEFDDTFAGEKEYGEWECETSGIYYARIRQYQDPDGPPVFGEGTEYELSLSQPYMPNEGFIMGRVDPPVSAKVITERSAVLSEKGKFFMGHEIGPYTLQVISEGYINYSQPIEVIETKLLEVDVALEASPQKGALKVSLMPGSAIDSGARWSVDFGDWHESQSDVSELSPGTHTVQFKPLQGWVTPADQTVTTVAGQTAETSAIYWRADDSCLVLDSSTFRLSVPCLEYAGMQWGFTFDYDPRPDVPSGLCWKLNVDTLTEGAGTGCLPMGSDFSIPLSCVTYEGTNYRFILDFYPHPHDPSGLYWEMDMSTLSVK